MPAPGPVGQSCPRGGLCLRPPSRRHRTAAAGSLRPAAAGRKRKERNGERDRHRETKNNNPGLLETNNNAQVGNERKSAPPVLPR